METAESVSMLDAQGLVAFGQLIDKTPQRAHVARLIVRPDARGRGCGRAMLGELLRRAERHGYACVSLYVNRANDVAMALYESLGFRLAEAPAQDAPSSQSWYMERMSATTSHEGEAPPA